MNQTYLWLLPDGKKESFIHGKNFLSVVLKMQVKQRQPRCSEKWFESVFKVFTKTNNQPLDSKKSFIKLLNISALSIGIAL